VEGAAVGGACLAAVLEKNKGTSTSLGGCAGVGGTCLAAVLKKRVGHQHWPWGRCGNSAGVGGDRLAAVFEENESAPTLAFSGSAWTVQE
jgi:hypothetical protein